jgi:hypothetical protein
MARLSAPHECQHTLHEAQEFSVIDVLRLPREIGVVVKKVPVLPQRVQLVQIRRVEHLFRRPQTLLANPAKISE